MSRFLSTARQRLTPYTPGEQPQDQPYIKLNTNESPFPPAAEAIERAYAEMKKLQLYPDPTCKELRQHLAKRYGVDPDEVLPTNGSDDVLNFAFLAFCDDTHPAVFPDITYGFYKVFAQLNGIPYREIPLKEDFTICIEDYKGLNQTIFIANPNAPTGIALPVAAIEEIVKSNPNGVVVVDEAYVDFGAESCVPLISRYDNLLVVQTFSKSRSMAGARLGMGIGCKALIRDLNTVKYSINPYTVNRMTMAAGIGALEAEEYTLRNRDAIVKNRENTAVSLREAGFEMPPSSTNFLFVKHPAVGGKELYVELKKRGILVRHFDTPRLTAYVRITIGTEEQMHTLLTAIRKILEERI